MSEKINSYALPEDLNINYEADVQLHEYRIFSSCLKNKISLTKNVFSFLKEGTKEVITDHKSTTIENNEFLIIKSGNCLMTETVSASNKTYNSTLLFFTNEALLDFLENNQLSFSNTQDSKSFIVSEYDQYIRHYVQSLDRIAKMKKPLQAKLLKAKFEEIMIYLIQKEGINFLNALLEKHDDKIVQFINVVENNKLKKLTLQELSFLCNMSLSTFKREFRKHYQMSPIKWFQEKRLEHAAFLLNTMKKRPIELFEEAGYESLSNFIQAFKKKYQLTPKQYQIKK